MKPETRNPKVRANGRSPLRTETQNTKRGFTLIELMIVIVIIAILAAVAVPNFVAARDRSRKTGCIGAMDAVRKALKMYLTDGANVDAYPSELSGKTYQGSAFAMDAPLGSLSKYTQVTGAIKSCESVTFEDVSAVGFTLYAVAKDRAGTILTATDTDTDYP